MHYLFLFKYSVGLNVTHAQSPFHSELENRDMFAEIVHSPSTNHVTSRLQITVWKHLYQLWTCKYLCNFQGLPDCEMIIYPEKSNSNFLITFSGFYMMKHDIDYNNIYKTKNVDQIDCNVLKIINVYIGYKENIKRL